MDPVTNNGQQDTKVIPPISNGASLPMPQPSPNASADTVKKYIRTFAGDMETLKKGGIPDLAPMVVTPTPATSVAPPPALARPEPAPAKQRPTTPPPPTPAFRPEPLPQPEPKNLHILSAKPPPPLPAFRPAPPPLPLPPKPVPPPPVPKPVPPPPPKPIPPPPPVSRPVPPPPPPKLTPVTVAPPKPPPVPPLPKPALQQKPTPLQTYTSDFSDHLKQTHASTASVLAAEQDAKRGPVRPKPPEPKKGGAVTVVAALFLIVLGAGGAFFAYTRYLSNRAPIILAPTNKTPLFVNEREEVTETGVILMRAITESVQRPLAAGAVRLLYLSSTTTPNVFLALQFPAPDILLRNINQTGGMAGVVHILGTQSPFFVLPAASYTDTFAGMLTWESNMLRDLAPLFPAYPLAPTDTATTTPTFSVFFHDEIVSNHDVRIYRDSSGRSVILYGYWNQHTLVVARDPEAFAEILSRLAGARTTEN